MKMPGWEYNPIAAQQEAEEARRRNEELYSTTPPRTSSGLNPAAKVFVPRVQRVASAVTNKLNGTNNTPQSMNSSPHEDTGVSNLDPATPKYAEGDEVMGLIKQVTQGDPNQERICELFQAFHKPGQPSPFRLNPAITHRHATDSGDGNVVQSTPAIVGRGSGCLKDEQAASTQPTRGAVTSGDTTSMKSGVATTAPVVPNSTALGYRFAMMFVNAREKGFEIAQVNAAMRAANNDPDRALELLLGQLPVNTKGPDIHTSKNTGFVQAKPIQQTATTTTNTTKGTSTGHLAAFESAPTMAVGSVAPKALTGMENGSQRRDGHSDYLGVCRSFQRAMHQANTEAALAPRRPGFVHTKSNKKN
ncbi:hypothetical protein VMCG_07767 [Cytospora schulzeri]|uniref:UBA domain-containing protein n=1 Tax=Cytospora schulzeri TaxID=448051 RepID=A0A423VZU5_9PEZI|nr:hypothetical protein VMCG_07767 [Valsa malicola]